ncbi:hypothetical protein [Bradyrhizobium sp. USDA 4486]
MELITYRRKPCTREHNRGDFRMRCAEPRKADIDIFLDISDAGRYWRTRVRVFPQLAAFDAPDDDLHSLGWITDPKQIINCLESDVTTASLPVEGRANITTGSIHNTCDCTVRRLTGLPVYDIQLRNQDET